MYKKLFLLIPVVLIIGCKAIPPETKFPLSLDKSRDITIFIDGTFNIKKDNTNIWKLFNNSLQNEKRASFYTVGVGGGPDKKFFGMAFGTGIGNDVREAYQYICRTYSKERKDRLHFLGFSRGAYTSKILANFIYLVGVLELKGIGGENEENIIKQLYRAYRTEGDYSIRKKRINKVVIRWEKKLKHQLCFQERVKIETLNLFDTVEALVAPDYTEKVCYPNSNHLEQFINVKKVNHAMSLDDNRARIFTPILATCNEIAVDRDINDFVEEVWFAGAHSDVGGGYSDNDKLSYFSLYWMMSKLKDYNLFKTPDPIDFNKFGIIHDAEGSGINKYIYRRQQRDIARYLKENKKYYNFGKIKIHQSVLDRLKKGNYNAPKLPKKNDTVWYDRKPFSNCFEKEGSKRIFLKEKCDCIEPISEE